METTPFTLYYEGIVQAGDEIYSYTPKSLFSVRGYRVILREVLESNFTITLKKNGVVLDTWTITAADSGDITLPSQLFNPNDILSLHIGSVTSPHSLVQGIVLILAVDVEDSISVDSSLLKQTPIIAPYAGLLLTGTSFFKTTITSDDTQFTGYRILARDATSSEALIAIRKNAVQVAVLPLSSGLLDTSGLLSLRFDNGDELELLVLQQNTPNTGAGLQVILDYSLLAQTSFTSFQTPFVVTYEGQLTAASSTIFSYQFPRPVDLRIIQAWFRDFVEASTTQIGLYKNGNLIYFLQIEAGESRSPVVQVQTSFNTGDELELRHLSAGPLGGSLVVTLDTFIDTSNAGITYYSDPDVDLVIKARQLTIGSSAKASISFEKLEQYKRDIDHLLNSRLSPLYRTPLLRTKKGRSVWPAPIQHIAQRLVLQHLLGDQYSQVEPNQAVNVQNLAQLAYVDLDAILEKRTILEGQRMRSRNYGSNPYTEPLNPNSSIQIPGAGPGI